jgi:hypothetical protein
LSFLAFNAASHLTDNWCVCLQSVVLSGSTYTPYFSLVACSCIFSVWISWKHFFVTTFLVGAGSRWADS